MKLFFKRGWIAQAQSAETDKAETRLFFSLRPPRLREQKLHVVNRPVLQHDRETALLNWSEIRWISRPGDDHAGCVGRSLTPMKITRDLVLVVVALIVGFCAGCWFSGQSNRHANTRVSTTEGTSVAVDKLNLLISYLQNNRETNAIKLFDDFETASIAIRSSADMGVRLHTLIDLREGRPNDAIQLMETMLKSDIITFAATFPKLSATQRQALGLGALSDANGYCTQFPQKEDRGLAQAFALLDTKNGK